MIFKFRMSTQVPSLSKSLRSSKVKKNLDLVLMAHGTSIEEMKLFVDGLGSDIMKLLMKL